MNQEPYYRVVLYTNNYEYPINFQTFAQAESFIFRLNLHAYITVK